MDRTALIVAEHKNDADAHPNAIREYLRGDGFSLVIGIRFDVYELQYTQVIWAVLCNLRHRALQEDCPR